MAGVLGREAERAAGNDQAVAVLGAIEGSVNHEAWDPLRIRGSLPIVRRKGSGSSHTLAEVGEVGLYGAGRGGTGGTGEILPGVSELNQKLDLGGRDPW